MNKSFSVGHWCLLVASIWLVTLNQVRAHGEEHMEVANKQVTIQDVCANRLVPIISVEEARRLIKDIMAEPGLCPRMYLQSFTELEPILHSDAGESVCGDRKFNQIKEYHFRFVNPLQESYKLGDDADNLQRDKIVRRPLDENKIEYKMQLDAYKQENMIPIALQQFFKAYVLQVSGLCKIRLSNNLQTAVMEYHDSDYGLINKMLQPGGLDPYTKKLIQSAQVGAQNGVAGGDGNSGDGLAQSNGGDDLDKKAAETSTSLDFFDLVYMPELEGERREGDIERRERVSVLDFTREPELNKLMHACQKRFKPVYSKLVLPIVKLSKLGYEYVGPQIEEEARAMRKSPEMLKLLAITKICESRGNFKLVEPEVEDPEIEAMKDYDYVVKYDEEFGNMLWIKGSEALRTELDRIKGVRATGFKKFLYQSGLATRKVAAFIDPMQFATYRRNQNTIGSFLNSMSIISNVISMSLSG